MTETDGPLVSPEWLAANLDRFESDARSQFYDSVRVCSYIDPPSAPSGSVSQHVNRTATTPTVGIK